MMVSIPPSYRSGSLSQLQAFAQLCRPTLGMMAALTCCTTIYALNPTTPPIKYLLTALVLLCISAAAFAINDHDDIEKDRINHPERPLPSGRLSLPQAWGAAVSLFTLALLAAIPLGPYPFILVAFSTLFLWFYSPLLTLSGILGNVIVAVIVAALIEFGSLVAGHPLAMLYPSGLLFCYILAKEIIWDVHDCVGDRSRGVITIANAWSSRIAFVIAEGLLWVAIGSIPVAIAKLPMAHPTLFALGSVAMLLSMALAIARYQYHRTASAYRGLMYWGRLGMLLGLIGILGTAPPF